ncbi:MAG: hypothetical protein ACKOAD_05930 [Gammaproteobacteria bacterium]
MENDLWINREHIIEGLKNTNLQKAVPSDSETGPMANASMRLTSASAKTLGPELIADVRTSVQGEPKASQTATAKSKGPKGNGY